MTDYMNTENVEVAVLVTKFVTLQGRGNSNPTRNMVHDQVNVFQIKISDKSDEEMKCEEELQKELDAKIREWERKIKEHHKNVGGAHTGSQHTVQIQKTHLVLENRLDQVNRPDLNN